MLRVAVLDDYQDVARKMTDWSVLPADVEVEMFRDHLTDQAAVAKRLKDFDIVMAMRERTPFPRTRGRPACKRPPRRSPTARPVDRSGR